MLIKDSYFNGVDVEGEVGIEIEVEGEILPNVNSKYWKTEVDNSLKTREAFEYVLKNPIKRGEVNKGLKNIKGYWIKSNSKIYDAHRAGIHVHINIRDLTLTELVSFITTYYIVEDFLVNYCGEDRIGNHFCLRSRDCEVILNLISKAIISNNLIKDLNTDDVRYASLNLKALGDYGSLEFRSMRSTDDIDLIKSWIDLLLCLKDYSKGKKPTNIVEQFSVQGVDKFITSVFGDDKKVLLFAGMKEEEVIDTLFQGVRRAQLIAYSKNWDKEEEDKDLIINF